MDERASADCAGCGWEGYPQAFHWFPEMGPPLVPAAVAQDDEELQPAGVRS